jgi:two-component system, NarL family, nitrate/nitrite response regulator NarL
MAHEGAHLVELTAREREILVLTADGRSAPDIAGRLHLSASTVNLSLLSSFEKLGVRDRAGAVAVAAQSGLLEMDSVPR